MEFQVYSVALEDRYPTALPPGITRHDLLHEGFHHDAAGKPLQKQKEGCVAFVFGRTEESRSICVRVEGVRPRLFFALGEGDQLPALRAQLEDEVRPQLRNTSGIKLTHRRYAHLYGYEPDATTASGREVHDYAEAFYPNLMSWRAACKLRRVQAEGDDGEDATDVTKAIRRPREAHEWFIDPTTRFNVETGITPGAWVRVLATGVVDQYVSTCDLEVEAGMDDFERVPGRTLNAPYTTLHYDIETLTLDPTADKVIQVSMVFVKGGAVEKHLVALGSVDPLEHTVVHACNTEAELLRTTRAVLVQHDPDFVVAYNGVNFDNNFLAVRAQRGHAAREDVEELFFLSRFALRKSRVRESKMTKAGRDYDFRYFDMPGRANFDWWVKFVTDDTSEPSYKLNHFARKFCGDTKEDMDYKEIPVLQAGTSADRARLGSYCVHDSYLLHLLDQKRNIITEILGYAQVFGINPEWVYFRGQQVRFYAQLMARVRTIEAVPLLMQQPMEGLSGEGEDTYEGATVNDPEAGYYNKEPVLCDDWMSLYPSEMLAHNLCYSTFVRKDHLKTASDVVAHEVRKLGLKWRPTSVVSAGPPPGGVVLEHPELERHLKVQRAKLGSDFGNASRLSLSYDELTALDLVHLHADHAIKAGSHYFQPDADAAHTTHFTTAHKGVLPQIIRYLLDERGKAKKEVKMQKKLAREQPEESAERVLNLALAQQADARQLALKVSCNSIYGACGANKVGKYYCLAVSETTTFQGRMAMVYLKQLLPKHFPGIRIIYGDSVAEYTPLLLRLHGQSVATSTPATLVQDPAAWHVTPDGKEAAAVEGVETWTEHGWVRVHTVFRHKADKSMYRVTTHTGTVDVTEDHSLVRADGSTIVAPKECIVGSTELLHAWPAQLPRLETGITVRMARILGMFVGDGSCGVYKYKSNFKYTWCIVNADIELLETYRDDCVAEFQRPFAIYDCLRSSGVYKLAPRERTKDLTAMFRGICYDANGTKQLPSQILNGTLELKTAFISGLYDADGVNGCSNGTRNGGFHTSLMRSTAKHWQAGSIIDQKSELVALGLYAILRDVGYNVSIGTRKDKIRIYRIRFTKQVLRRPETLVKKAHPIVYTGDYVYDLSTDAPNHFHAGVGQIIVHNTDSIMYIRPDIPDMETCGRKGHEVSELVTADYANRGYPDMKLEFEKAYKKYLLFKKKRYAGEKYEPGPNQTMVFKGIDAKGVETERKDTLPFLKDMYNDALDALLKQGDVEAAYAAIARPLKQLVDDEVPFDKLVMSKSLSASYKNEDAIVQARVNSKRREREAGSEESVGGRVHYVIVNGHKKDKTTDLAEDAEYARKNGLQLNRLWYLEHMIEKPIKSLFVIVPGVDMAGLFDRTRVALDAARLGVGDSLRALVKTGGGGGGSSSTAPANEAPAYVPRPPPAPLRKKRKP